jgi:hypothetical protein
MSSSTIPNSPPASRPRRRVSNRTVTSDEEKLAILKETTELSVIVAVVVRCRVDRDGPDLHLVVAIAEERNGEI